MRRARLAAVAIGIVALVAAIALRNGPAPAPPSSAPRPESASAAPRLDRRHELAAETGAMTIRRAAPDLDAPPSRRGEEWRKRWLAYVDRIHRREFGDDIAALLRLPPGRAWDALERLALEGDGLAARALDEFANECMFSPRDFNPERYGRAVARALPEPTIQFVVEGVGMEKRALEQHYDECRAAGIEARYRGYRQQHPGDVHAPSVLETSWSDLLERVGGGIVPLDRAEDIERLLAATPPDLFDPIVACLGGPYCEDMKPDALPAERREAWIEHAASLGNEYAIETMVRRRRDAGDVLDAYAWASFGAWLARRGCVASPGLIAFVNRAIDQQTIIDAMPLDQSRAALQRAAALIDRLGAAALAAQRCTE